MLKVFEQQKYIKLVFQQIRNENQKNLWSKSNINVGTINPTYYDHKLLLSIEYYNLQVFTPWIFFVEVVFQCMNQEKQKEIKCKILAKIHKIDGQTNSEIRTIYGK